MPSLMLYRMHRRPHGYEEHVMRRSEQDEHKEYVHLVEVENRRLVLSHSIYHAGCRSLHKLRSRKLHLPPHIATRRSGAGADSLRVSTVGIPDPKPSKLSAVMPVHQTMEMIQRQGRSVVNPPPFRPSWACLVPALVSWPRYKVHWVRAYASTPGQGIPEDEETKTKPGSWDELPGMPLLLIKNPLRNVSPGP